MNQLPGCQESQQKCIVIFALVCCFAVLVALIFSAVDVWGEDEDGITEENCSRNCRVVLVENIPEDISFLENGTSHLPLSAGLYNLLDKAIRVVEIVSPLWLLNSSDYESSFQPAAKQRKELGVLVYNCSCLALDLHRVFSLYWGLQYKDFIPSFWSKRLFALFNKDTPLQLTFNSTKAQAYISSSPDLFIPKDRSNDLEAISRVIQEARHFIYISIIDYLPLLSSSSHRYWSRIDGFIREALILRKVRVRLLISCWEKTHPLTFNFIWSLRSLCMEQANCSLEALLQGNLDWVGNEFAFNAGAGLVISQPEGIEERNATVVEQLRAAFDRDWFSRYTRSLQANKIPVCNKHQISRLVPVKTSHLDNGPVPFRTEQHDNGPAPMRNRQMSVKTKHHDDRLEEISRQGMTNGLVPIIDSYQDRGHVKMSHVDNRQVQIKDNYNDNPVESASQSAESSGSREISNGSL
ncbi:hypothetical protein PAMP_001441 [Pampus punctatissimus]